MRLLVPWSYLFLFITCKRIIIIIINIIKTAVAPNNNKQQILLKIGK